jgi:hypothetical protein
MEGLYFKKSPIFFPEWLNQLAFPSAVDYCSFFPTSLPTLVVGGVLHDGYSNEGELES